ncbi:MAG: MarR family transcriptional regulator [Isosphaeraceae bacterium]
MHPGSRRDRIIVAMRMSPSPLDDDQLADLAGISPRQSVNQICRELERAEMVRRRPGPDPKIVNEWLGNQDRQPDSAREPPVPAFLSNSPRWPRPVSPGCTASGPEAITRLRDALAAAGPGFATGN